MPRFFCRTVLCSLLYRGLNSFYKDSEPDGAFRYLVLSEMIRSKHHETFTERIETDFSTRRLPRSRAGLAEPCFALLLLSYRITRSRFSLPSSKPRVGRNASTFASIIHLLKRQRYICTLSSLLYGEKESQIRGKGVSKALRRPLAQTSFVSQKSPKEISATLTWLARDPIYIPVPIPLALYGLGKVDFGNLVRTRKRGKG